MGKGFNNYMCKKFFHPASRDNLKRVWMAEQKADSYKKKQEELRVQYEKEQDLYTNKALLSKESKDKLSVNFMYEPPPGTKKEREREDDEPEYKFEWQRKFNAPREDYCKGDSEIRDQPFGIQVRNVRCIKCHKWGHINTDKECPMYNQSSSAENTASSLDTHLLLQQMREDGLAMKKSALSLQQQTSQRSVKVESEDDRLKASDIEMLKSLSKKQKKKLLRVTESALSERNAHFARTAVLPGAHLREINSDGTLLADTVASLLPLAAAERYIGERWNYRRVGRHGFCSSSHPCVPRRHFSVRHSFRGYRRGLCWSASLCIQHLLTPSAIYCSYRCPRNRS